MADDQVRALRHNHSVGVECGDECPVYWQRRLVKTGDVVVPGVLHLRQGGTHWDC